MIALYIHGHKNENIMTAKCALAMALLEGRVLNVSNVFKTIGLTNCSREISRMIEQPFGLQISRTPMKGTSRYGNTCTWYDFRLNRTAYNKEGIQKLKAYVKEQLKDLPPARTEKEKIRNKQQSLFLDSI